MEQPGVEIEPQAKRGRRRGRPRSRALAWVRRVMIVLLVIGIAPALVSLAYIPAAVHPVSTLMMKDAVTGRGYTREWLPLEEIDPRLVNAVMMSEDGQFCVHPGVDLGELRAIVGDFLDGAATRGGSTITMQTVKNLYLWHGRSYLRKAIEIPYAVYLDLVMPKRRIMEIYLNIAEWAPGIYGAEAAAQHHFGKSARKLTAREAALLAVTLPAPAVRTPGKPSAQLSRLAARIERRANHAGGYNLCLR